MSGSSHLARDSTGVALTGGANDGGKQQALPEDKEVRDEKSENRQTPQSPWPAGTCQSLRPPLGTSALYAVCPPHECTWKEERASDNRPRSCHRKQTF